MTRDEPVARPVSVNHPLDRSTCVGGIRRRTGHLRAVVDAHVLPSLVWHRLRREADEHVERYARGEHV